MDSSIEYIGKIKFYNAKTGFGFVVSNDGHEYYFKSKSLTINPKCAIAEIPVRFKLIQSKRGKEAIEINFF